MDFAQIYVSLTGRDDQCINQRQFIKICLFCSQKIHTVSYMQTARDSQAHSRCELQALLFIIPVRNFMDS